MNLLTKKNTWLWFHFLAGGILAFLLQLITTEQKTVIAVLILAIAWEVVEYLKDDVERVYGSLKAFLVDAIQDVAAAFIASIIVILAF